MEITPPPTSCAERILGLAEELRAVRVDGPIQLLFKLSLLCLCMSLGLRVAMYERGLPAGRKSAAGRRVATPALRRTAVGAPREIRDREPGFDAAVPAGAGEATEAAAEATDSRGRGHGSRGRGWRGSRGRFCRVVPDKPGRMAAAGDPRGPLPRLGFETGGTRHGPACPFRYDHVTIRWLWYPPGRQSRVRGNHPARRRFGRGSVGLGIDWTSDRSSGCSGRCSRR